MKEINEAILGKYWNHPARHLLNRTMCVLYNGDYFEDVKVIRLINPDKVEVYIPKLDKKVVTHPSFLDEGVNLLDTLRYLGSKRNRKLAEKEADKYRKTGNNIHAKKALYHFDKAKDLELIATAPNKKAKEYVKARRDEIETERMKDYLEHGVGKEFYED